MSRRTHDEDGVAVALVVTLVGVLVTVMVAGTVVGGAFVAKRRADAAADLAALAGAEAARAGRDACAAVGALARRNGAEVTACRVVGQDVLVEVSVALAPWGQRWDVPGRARAGPG